MKNETNIQKIREACIKGYEGYYVACEDGSIRGLKRVVKSPKGTRIAPERTLKPTNAGIGYLRVELSKDGVAQYFLVHRLIAQTFHPNPENKRTVNHINGDKADNRACNLEWATYSENCKHAYRIGLSGNKKQYAKQS